MHILVIYGRLDENDEKLFSKLSKSKSVIKFYKISNRRLLSFLRFFKFDRVIDIVPSTDF